MTFEEAQAYWRTMHGPLARSTATSQGDAAVHPGAPLRVPRGGGAAGIAGNGSRALYRPCRGVDGPVGSRGSVPRPEAAGERPLTDEAKFIDFARSACWVGKEHVLIDRWY